MSLHTRILDPRLKPLKKPLRATVFFYITRTRIYHHLEDTSEDMDIRHFKRRRVKEARLGYLVQAVLPSRQPSPVKSLFNKAVLHHKKTLT